MVHASLAEEVIEQVWEDRGDKAGVLIVGDPEKGKRGIMESAKTKGMKVAWWEEIWEVAEKVTEEKAVLPGRATGSDLERQAEIIRIDTYIYDVHCYFYSLPSPNSSPVVVKVNHLVCVVVVM